jgi:nucleotide-binding universal stress UspA family protein
MERFKSILVDVDATAAVHYELERAVSLARRCGASLTIVDSTTLSAYAPGALPADIYEDVVAARRHELARLARRVPEIPTTSRVLVGESATVLIQEVLGSKHDLLVRSHARDLTAGGSRHHGAVDEELLRKCPCSVLLVGPGRTPERPRIVGVVTVGREDPAEDALRVKVVALTLLLARLEDGAPMLLQTWVPFAEEMIRTNSLEDAFAAYVEAVRLRTAGDLAYLTRSLDGHISDVRTMSRRGEPEDVVPAFVVREGIDLVVMATPISSRGITGMLFGRASQNFLQKLTCSLLAVKSDGYVSPVRLPVAI